MSMFDQIDKMLDSTGELPAAGAQSRSRWVEVCVCGHEGTYHGQDIGGAYGTDGSGVTTDGCVGAVPNRDQEMAGRAPDGTFVKAPTCPCTVFRPVVEIDRPGRYFRQKTWTKDRIHPMIRGFRAQRTRLAGSKEFGDCADEEVERRTRWLDGARKCRVCGRTGDDVWPSYVNEGRLSQMRCRDHWQSPRAEAP